jgi:hypothetical protein
MNNDLKQNIREWWYVLRVAIPTLIVLLFLDIPMKWKHAIGATVIVFYVVILLSRNHWRNKIFWIGLIILFMCHATLMIVLNLSLPEKSMGLRGFPLIIFTMWEGVFIGGGLNRLCNRKSSFRTLKKDQLPDK